MKARMSAFNRFLLGFLKVCLGGEFGVPSRNAIAELIA